VVPAAFYRMAPEGLSLACLTIQRQGGRGGNTAELDRIFDDAVVPQIMRKRKAFIDPEAFHALFGDLPDSDETPVPRGVMHP